MSCELWVLGCGFWVVSCGFGKSSKFLALNPKQIQMTKEENSKQRDEVVLRLLLKTTS